MQLAMDLLAQISEENKQTEENITIAFTALGDFTIITSFIYYICKGESIMGTQSAINM